MKKLIYIYMAIMLVGLLFVTACQTNTGEAYTTIPVKDIPKVWNTDIEAPDDIVPTPGGGTYRANVHQEGVENPCPPIESTSVVIGSGTDALTVSYRNYIQTSAGETRNNIILIMKEGGLLNSQLALYSTNIPAELELADGGRGVGLPGTLGAILVIEIATDAFPGEYPLEIGLMINGKDYGTITCTINVIPEQIQSWDALRLIHASPYLVVGETNLANEDLSRSVGLWLITSEEASDYEGYAQTAAQAVLDLYDTYIMTFTSVILIPREGVEIAYAQANFATDGKGAAGMTGSSPATPGYWKIRVADRKLTEQELAIAELWAAKQQDFPQKNPWSSLSYDAEALRQYISDTLNIPYEQVQMPELEMAEYQLDQSFIDGTVEMATNRKSRNPITEIALHSLLESGNLSDSEIAIIDSMVNEVSEEIKSQFALKYEAAENVSRDSSRHWMAYSSWRPYRQSEEYQQLLEFCKGKGKTIWPLVLQKLDSENAFFAGGLIIDITIPEYLYYFEDTVRQSNLRNEELDIIAYFRELSVLLQERSH
ncbi:MAG: DUF4875 domain-containing protein [Dehalococcoidales bacterium]|nr:DUF4875 domain-containing protein [Dehalococcoidales bacterium]